MVRPCGFLASKPHGHPNREVTVLSEAVTGIQAPPGRICHQGNESIWWNPLSDLVEQPREDAIAEAAPLVSRQHRHVNHVEVPTAIADQPPHSHRGAFIGTDDMAGSPTAA
jgi:hypothetical protein